jgi:hypothetical protein
MSLAHWLILRHVLKRIADRIRGPCHECLPLRSFLDVVRQRAAEASRHGWTAVATLLATTQSVRRLPQFDIGTPG